MRHQLRFALHALAEAVHERGRDARVQLLAPAAQHTRVGGVVQQRVLELIPNRRAVELAQDVFVDQVPERRAQVLPSERLERLEQSAIELATEDRGDVEY